MTIKNQQKNTAPLSQKKSSSQKQSAWLVKIRLYQNFIFFTVLLIIVLAASALVWTWNQKQTAEKAFRMLAVARTSEQWEEIIKEHPKTLAAPLALLALASEQYHSGNYSEALDSYEQFKKQYSGHQMLPAADLGTALAYEAKRDIQLALNAFEKFLISYPDHFLTSQALFGKARCLEQNKDFSAARIIYEDFIAENPESPWASQAKQSLLFLKQSDHAAKEQTPQPLTPDTVSLERRDEATNLAEQASSTEPDNQ